MAIKEQLNMIGYMVVVIIVVLIDRPQCPSLMIDCNKQREEIKIVTLVHVWTINKSSMSMTNWHKM